MGLLLDPSNLTGTRRAVSAAIKGRYTRIERSLRALLVADDALGIQNEKSRKWKFLTSADKVKAFEAWLQEQVDAGLMQADPGTPQGQPWLSKYIRSAYVAGVRRSVQFAKPTAKSAEEDVTLEAILMHPARTDMVQLLYTRNFTQLKTVASNLHGTLSQILSKGLVSGTGATALTGQMVKAVGVSRAAAERIARTELTYAQSEGQLDGLEATGLGSTGVQLLAEWLTGARPCASCAALAGVVLTIQEARGKIPYHPNCMCAWLPVDPYAKKTAAQVKSKRGLRQAINAAVKAETGKRTVRDARKASAWAGANLRPVGKRTLTDRGG